MGLDWIVIVGGEGVECSRLLERSCSSSMLAVGVAVASGGGIGMGEWYVGPWTIWENGVGFGSKEWLGCVVGRLSG